MEKPSFEELIEEALEQEFSGWDFSWMQGRYYESEPFWNYSEMVQERMKGVTSMLDMGTGGGEFLAGLPDLPGITYATEGYPPNIPIAKQRLEPLGVKVVAVHDEHALSLPDAMFDLVINRHEYYDPAELMRILKPGGIFLTQQVGPRNCAQLNQYLDAPLDPELAHWKLAQETEALEEAGFSVLQCHEQILESNFYDIGAVVFYLKVIGWQIEGFSVEKFEPRLRNMHQLIEQQGAFYATEHRFLMEAKKPV
ncbi:MAG: methyltransferase domain-containing protein [Anaerolineaceae bacterium]|nr:methyltransferase domain-containing protein [Anaerolineaceae bacterium]